LTERLTLPRRTHQQTAANAVPTGAPTRREYLAAALVCAVASLAAQVWSWQNHAMLNYGDAIAHLHIARRVFDSHRPGLTQLGSVWLPLPHLLMLPFVQVYAWWADGIAGAIPSALAYMGACLGLYRLARRWLPSAPCALALGFFALNPNLLYLQTTAMDEPIFLCELIWIAVLVVEWRASLDEDPARSERLFSLTIAVLIAAVFTRYDGWVIAFLVWIAMAVTLARRGRANTRAFWIGSVLLAAAPAAWFAYNAGFFGDWLYFARGPFSAKAIELRTAPPGNPPHPGWHNPWISLLYFLKVSELDAAGARLGNLLVAVSALGTLWAYSTMRRQAFKWALLLWIPIPFYACAVAYGSVPIFIPPWWPHSWYNTRYGMELMPALALGLAFDAQMVFAVVRELKPSAGSGRRQNVMIALLAVLVGFNCVEILRQHPLTYVEGTKNAAARRAYDVAIPPLLRSLLATRPNGVILMNTSLYPELVSRTGIPLRQTLNESDKQYFKAALADPAGHAAIVIAFGHDDVDRAIKAHPQGLTLVRRFTAKGQPPAAIYVSGAGQGASSRAQHTRPQRVLASG
jgi:hypothetical protein